MFRRALCVGLATAGIVVCIPERSAATPITIKLEGKAFFYDHNPPPSFESQMNELGVIQGISPFLVTMTINDAAPRGAFGRYLGALMGGFVSLGGNLEYRFGPADLYFADSPLRLKSEVALLYGPPRPIPFPGFPTPDIIPNWAALNLFYDQFTGTDTDDLAAVMRTVNTWSSVPFAISLFLTEHGVVPPFGPPYGEGNIIYSGLTVTSVTVPEPSPLLLASGAALALLPYARRFRRRPTLAPAVADSRAREFRC